MKDRYTRFIDSDLAQADATTESGGGSGKFTDDSVGRDRFRLITAGIEYQDFLNAGGPMPFGHDDSQPPVAQAVRIALSEDEGHVFWRWVPRETYALAGTIADLVDDGFIRGLSASWRPLESKPSRDPARPGGIDFLRSDLLEISFVVIPALASALIDARSRGIDTRPLAAWCERQLDTHRYGQLSRGQLEAVYRSARAETKTLTSLGYYHHGDTARHVERAVKLHRKLLKKQAAAGEHLDGVDDALTRMAALGYVGTGFAACFGDLKRSARGLRSVHRSADRTHERLGDALENARESVGNETDPVDTTVTAPYATMTGHDTDAGRAARAARARQLAAESRDPLAKNPEEARLRAADR
jgi:phage head maturation protease